MRVWQLHGSDAADLRLHLRRCSTKSNEAEGYDDDGDRVLKDGARVLRGPFVLHDRDHRQLLVRLFRRSRESGNLELRGLVARPWAPAFAGATEKSCSAIRDRE